MSEKRGTDSNNLSASLHSIISGDTPEAVNIPYVDDEEPVQILKTNGKSSVSISSNESYSEYDEKVNYNSRRRAPARMYGTGNEASDESDTDDGHLASEKQDKPGPLASDVLKNVEVSNLSVMRRNSFSMPTLNDNDLDALRNLHMKAVESSDTTDSKESLTKTTVIDDTESMVCSIAERESEQEEKPEPEAEPMFRSKFRSKRRLSVAPLPAIRLNDRELMVNQDQFDAQSTISAAPSVTSVNSLASLLKEKMQVLPSKMRKRKKPQDYKLRGFVGFLFLVIVFLVGYAYIMYNQQIMSRLYFDNVKFKTATRLLHVFDAKGVDVLSGNLGVELGSNQPFTCRDKTEDGSFCWEWTKQAKLFINLDKKFTGTESAPNTRCYTFRWVSLDEKFNPIDCFNIGEDRGQWYGGGLTRNADWQLDRASFAFAPFVSGDIRMHQWGNAIRRYFINSQGVAIEIDDETPLHISINDEYKSQFCLKAQHDSFAFINRPTPLPELKYRICTAKDMKVLHHNLTQKNLWDGLKEQDINVIKTMFDEPVWEVTGNLTDVSISDFTNNVIALGYFRLGHVLINEQWQHFAGDFAMDEDRFQTLNDTINVLHRRGFRISLTIQPYVSTQSHNFDELLSKRLLVYERSTQRSVPALTKFRNAPSVGVLDATNNETASWLVSKLEKTIKKYMIDSFYIEFGSAYDMPRFYECHHHHHQAGGRKVSPSHKCD